MEEIEFRYTPVALLITVWGGLALLAILLCRLVYIPTYAWLQWAAIDPGSICGVLLVCIIGVALMLLIMLIPFIIALNVTDLRGTAVLEDECVHLHFLSRTRSFAYRDITSLRYNPLPRRSTWPMGPVFRLQIKAGRRNTAIAGSSKEAWENRKSKKAPQLQRAYRAILSRLPET